MKNFKITDWILFLFACSISLVIVISVIGIVFKGTTPPNEGAVQIRAALIDLLKYIVGGIFGSMGTAAIMKTDK